MYEVISLKDDITSLIPFGSIIQALTNLFAGADPGHMAPDGRFIPGDLQSRLQDAASRISFYGVASVVDNNIVYDILTEVPPAQFQGPHWQETLDNYLAYLQTGLRNGTIIPGQVTDPLIPGGTGGGFVYNFNTFGSFFPLILLGAGGYYLLKGKKKSKKRRR